MPSDKLSASHLSHTTKNVSAAGVNLDGWFDFYIEAGEFGVGSDKSFGSFQTRFCKSFTTTKSMDTSLGQIEHNNCSAKTVTMISLMQFNCLLTLKCVCTIQRVSWQTLTVGYIVFGVWFIVEPQPQNHSVEPDKPFSALLVFNHVAEILDWNFFLYLPKRFFRLLHNSVHLVNCGGLPPVVDINTYAHLISSDLIKTSSDCKYNCARIFCNPCNFAVHWFHSRLQANRISVA